jgi:hypothetical protein
MTQGNASGGSMHENLNWLEMKRDLESFSPVSSAEKRSRRIGTRKSVPLRKVDVWHQHILDVVNY